MKAHYLKMFAYNAWANQLFLQCLESRGVANPKVFLLLSHVFNAEEVWLCRIQNRTAPNQNIWKEYSLLQLQEKALQQKEAWEFFLEGLRQDDLSRSVHYRNSKGHEFSTEVADILNHVINHGTYHRAQVASILRLDGIDPPVSDYIAYVRKLYGLREQ